MFLDNKYAYQTNSQYLDYEFESVGPKGIIKKVARFTKLDAGPYNFGFGDLDPITGEISDEARSNNGDEEKVLNTVANIIYTFTTFYPNSAVFIKGSTPSRTRRYQMGINKNWAQIHPIFEVWGLKNGRWEKFKPGENYEAFLGRRKASFLF